MKFLIFTLIVLLSGCGVQKDKAKNTKVASEHKSYHRQVSLPQEEQEPIYTETTLGEAATPLLDNSAARVENINIACGAINGISISPGESFSFNDTVGKRTAERGFQDAKVIVDGHSDMGCGGGVCQVSSTLHMAAVNAGLQIDERHPHSHAVPYAPDGGDATVVSGEKDLRITNSTQNIIILYIWVQEDNVFSKITQKGA